MIWFERFSRTTEMKKRAHVYLCEQPHWRIAGVCVFDGFFRELPTLVPEGAIRLL